MLALANRCNGGAVNSRSVLGFDCCAQGDSSGRRHDLDPRLRRWISWLDGWTHERVITQWIERRAKLLRIRERSDLRWIYPWHLNYELSFDMWANHHDVPSYALHLRRTGSGHKQKTEEK